MTTPENTNPAVVAAIVEPHYLKRPLVSEDPSNGEPWYLFQIRFMHNEVVYATTIYARNDAEAEDIVTSLKESAIVDMRLAPIIRRGAPEQPA